jgi:methyl-accepting chemotaxis protein
LNENLHFARGSNVGRNWGDSAKFYREVKEMPGCIGKKLVLSFMGIALIGLISGVLGYYGVSLSQKAVHEIGSVRLPGVENLLILAREAENIKGSLHTLSISGLDMETRNREYENIHEARKRYQAAWERYESLPKTDEESGLWKKFIPAWIAWKETNDQYLELNYRIDSNGIVNPEQLGRQLEQFSKDHYVLALRVLEMLFMGTPVFEGGEDATLCNAGQWMPLFKTTNPDLLLTLERINAQHQKFHENIHLIKNSLREGKHDEAVRMYKEDLFPVMQNVFAYFKTMLVVANDSTALVEQGNKLLLSVSRERQDTALALLGKIIKHNRDVTEMISGQAEAQARFFKTLTLFAVIVGMILSVVFGVLSSRNIARPLKRVASHLKLMAQGDFSSEVNEKDCLRSDEIGVLSQAAEALTGSMCVIIGNIQSGIGTLTLSSSDLAGISDQMMSSVVNMSSRTISTAAAAEESSVKSNAAAVSMEQATANLSTVASATVQMSTTISKIAGNAEQVKIISDEASRQADAVTAIMKGLGDAAQKIGKVTETITAISEQTNLLALNATIEAGRAGEAGRGFSVVAGEIKELSRQTSGATKDIRDRIDAIQSSTRTAIGDINLIVGVIKTVNEVVPQMAAAIEEQSVVTRGVADNIAQATTGISSSNERVMQTARMSADIAGDIVAISETVSGIQSESDQVQQSAAEMLALAGQLQAAIVHFKMCKGKSTAKNDVVAVADELIKEGFFDALPA